MNPPKASTLLALGTRKGLFLLHSRDRRRWRTRGPYFAGVSVHHAFLDPRDGRTIWAAVNSEHWGPSVVRSRDGGTTWSKPNGPRYPKASGLSVDRVWNVAADPSDGGLWAGVEPAGLFRSRDDGRTWEGVEGLNGFAGRAGWMPGGGGLNLHTILPYPNETRRMIVGASAVGVFGTGDGGRTWRLMNGGVRSGLLPQGRTDEDEPGSCVHKVVRDPRDPAVVFMQNHWGVYRRRRGDAAWTDVSKGLPSRFGFPLAAHPRDSATVYTVPLEADTNRVAPGGAFAVYRTRDGGRRWQRLAKGLPQNGAWFTVLREGLATDRREPAGVYVGTTTGQLYASRDEGDSWTSIAETLPPILSVTAGAWDPRVG